MRSKTLFTVLTLAVAGMSGCATGAPPGLPGSRIDANVTDAPAISGNGVLEIHPFVETGGRIQAVVPNYTISTIHHVIVKLFRYDPGNHVETDLNLSRDLASLHVSGGNFLDAVSFGNLKCDLTYRIKCYAYKAAGTAPADLISTQDVNSVLDVVVAGGDNAPTIANLPIKLINVAFAASTTLAVSTVGSVRYSKIKASLFQGADGLGTLRASASSATAHTFTLAQLDANTTYSVTLAAVDAANAVLSLPVSAVNFTISSDNAPVSQSAVLPVPFSASTLAGSGTAGHNNATGTSATLSDPRRIALDASGNLFVADSGSNQIREITPAGVVTLFAGFINGNSGNSNGTGSGARFTNPTGIALAPSGSFYVGDTGSNMIRMVTSGAVVTSPWGTSTAGYVNGIGTAATFNQPSGLVADSTYLYVADAGNHCIRKVPQNQTQATTTFAGAATGPTSGFLDGTGTGARFNLPEDVARDTSGTLYVADTGNHAIRKITPAGVVTTYAGSYPTATSGYRDGTAATALFNSPRGVCVDGAGNVYVADSGNHRIRLITPAGQVYTMAGSGSPAFADGVGAAAAFNAPRGVAVTPLGDLYVGDGGNNRVRKLH